VHVAGSVLLWTCALKLTLSTRERLPAAQGQQAVPGPAVSGPPVSEPTPS
jgi:hypothetical protein